MDIWSKERRSEVMGLVKSRDTKPEIKLRKALFSLGYRYRLHVKNLPGKPDIVLPKYRAVIFIHGCFWHGHIGCKAARRPKSNLEYWEPKLARNVVLDQQHSENLIASGWNVIVVWECDLRKNFQHVVDGVANFLAGTNYTKTITYH